MSVRIINGDCRDVLPTLAADSFDCIVTSPPYWGLRDYGVEGQIGLEPTMQGYLETMVGVCRELRRVLKQEGTCWINVGDTYAANRGGTTPPAETLAGGVRGHGGEDAKRGRKDGYNPSRDPRGHGLKHKDLCLIPNRLAILLQEDGWYVRSEIIWFKANPMPESVRDRPTCAHEKVWLLTKGPKYHYDADAIAEPVEHPTMLHKSSRKNAEQEAAYHGNAPTNLGRCGTNPLGRNARNVWPIASQPFSGAHFATMPPALAERCIKAGCPVGGMVLDPFGGAGTTGLVADRLGRHATLIELNPAYREIAAERVTADSPLFMEVR
jgi:DNA modification methylase